MGSALVIVLDTHVLLWWVNGGSELSARADELIAAEQAGAHGRILVSAITAWEVVMLQQRGRLRLAMDVDEWLRQVATLDRLEFVSISTNLAVQSVRLPEPFHKDPADRFIVALARELNVPLLSADQKIREYPHVRCLW